jgi:hypothetical protein
MEKKNRGLFRNIKFNKIYFIFIFFLLDVFFFFLVAHSRNGIEDMQIN